MRIAFGDRTVKKSGNPLDMHYGEATIPYCVHRGGYVQPGSIIPLNLYSAERMIVKLDKLIRENQ